jgi:N-acetylglucosamine-6-phosphate deacetylase
MKKLITNCRLVSPDLEMEKASILIDGNMIEDLFSSEPPKETQYEVFDAEGNCAFPGFIDIHTHGAGGCDVTDGKKESIEKIASLKVQEGVTTFCPTTLTLPEEKLSAALASVAEYMNDMKFAKVAGVHLEGPFINPECTGAQNPAFVRKPDIEEIRRLDKIAKVAIVTYAVETEGGIKFTEQLSKMGITASCGHSAAKYADIAEGRQCGLKHLTHFCNQMTPLHHREIAIVGAGLLDDSLTIEIICDKLHISPDMIRLIFRHKDPERTVLITDSVCASWLDDGKYDLGGLEVYVKNGAARLVSNDALAGSTLHYNTAFRNAAELSGIPLKELVKTTSWNQARSLGLEKLGKLEKGFFADIVILDSEFNVKSVFINGEEVQ